MLCCTVAHIGNTSSQSYSVCHFWFLVLITVLPSVLSRCWLGGRKGIRPVKTECLLLVPE